MYQGMGGIATPLVPLVKPSHLHHLTQLVSDIKKFHMIHICAIHINWRKFTKIYTTISINRSIIQFITIFLRKSKNATVVCGSEKNH